MNRITRSLVPVGFAVSLSGATPAPSPPASPSAQFESTTGQEEAHQAARFRLLHAQPFQLDDAYVHGWCAERPSVSSGFLLVLETRPELLERSSTAEPVLFVGDQVAERLNNGAVHGRVVVVVPSRLNESGELTLDLRTAPIWFGDRGFPESVSADDIARSRDRALKLGIRAPRSSDVEVALRRGGGTLFVPNRGALRIVAADLIEWHAPDEVDLVRGIRGR